MKHAKIAVQGNKYTCFSHSKSHNARPKADRETSLMSDYMPGPLTILIL